MILLIEALDGIVHLFGKGSRVALDTLTLGVDSPRDGHTQQCFADTRLSLENDMTAGNGGQQHLLDDIIEPEDLLVDLIDRGAIALQERLSGLGVQQAFFSFVQTGSSHSYLAWEKSRMLAF